MDDRQKRVMLKVLAVSAFLNHRDFRYSTPESIDRLRNDTKWVLSQPLTSESRGNLLNMCMQVGRAALVPAETAERGGYYDYMLK